MSEALIAACLSMSALALLVIAQTALIWRALSVFREESERQYRTARSAFTHLRATSATEAVTAENARDEQQEALRQVRDYYERSKVADADEGRDRAQDTVVARDGLHYTSAIREDGTEELLAPDGRRYEVLS